jgi:hypothetical protein
VFWFLLTDSLIAFSWQYLNMVEFEITFIRSKQIEEEIFEHRINASSVLALKQPAVDQQYVVGPCPLQRRKQDATFRETTR